jgi:tetratricopeptide (TPR) repeat protein
MFRKIVLIAAIVAVATMIQANQWHDEADRCWNEAQKYKKERNYKQALVYLKRAVAAEKKNEVPRSNELVTELQDIGKVYDLLGNYEKSLHYYKLMLKAAQKSDIAEQQPMAMISIGQSYFNLKRFDEALDSYGQALDFSKKYGYKDRMVLVLDNMASVYRERNDFNRALEKYTEALTIAKESKSAYNTTVIVSNRGTMYFFKGDLDRALEDYTRSLELDRKSGHEESLSIDLSNMGGVYAAQGRYGEALNYFEKSLEIDTRQKNEKHMAARLNRIGDVYYRLGEYNSAIENYNRSLEINMKLNNVINAAHLQGNLGRLYESMGKYEEAMEYYIKALALSRSMELQENIAVRLSDIGMLYDTRERYGEALDYLGKALQKDLRAEKRIRVADDLSNIARVMVSLKKYDRALEYLKQSLEIYRDLGETISISDDLIQCGIINYYRKEYVGAVENLTQARTLLENKALKNSQELLDAESDVYRWLVATYVRAEMPDNALESNEKLSIKKINLLVSDFMPVKQCRPAGIEKMKQHLGKKCAAITFANIQWDNPIQIYADSSSTIGYEMDKAAVVKEIYNAMGKDIEKFIGQNKSEIIFKVEQKSRKDYYYVDFEKIINYYRSLLSKKYITNEENDTLKRLGRILYTFLFSRIEKKIAGIEDLIIQPDGILTTIPFETLIMPDGRFMAEKFNIRYTYSLTCGMAYAEKSLVTGRKSILAMGGSNLPPDPQIKNIESSRHYSLITRAVINKIRKGGNLRDMYGFFGIGKFNAPGSGLQEIGDIRSIATDTESAWGEMSLEPELKKRSAGGGMMNFRILHFVTTGIIIPEVPQLSVLLLQYKKNDGESSDGLLNIREIAALKISADHVHIAGIYIPPVGYSRGEGIWNLCNSFNEAGARSVSLSLWPVDDPARSNFMKQVYRLVLKGGLTFDKAFTRTRLSYIKGEKATAAEGGSSGGETRAAYSNPYYWGSFILYGY